MIVGVAPISVPTTGIEVVGRICLLVARQGVRADLGETDATDPRERAGEGSLHDLLADSQGLEDLRTVVRGSRRDAHLRHDLQNAGVDRLNVALDHLIGIHVVELTLGMERVQRLQGEIGMHGIGAEANQARNLVDITGVSAVGHD